MPYSIFKRLFILAMFLLFSMPGRAFAQQGIRVSRDEARVEFPTGIRFFLTTSSSAEIQSITLLYGTNRQTCQPGQALKVLEFTPSPQVSLDWTLEFVRSGIIPPGAELWWQWEIKDAAGQTLRTEKKTARVNDQRWRWRSLSDGPITVQWYEGSQAYGQRLLATSLEALQRMEKEQGLLPSSSIWITVYPSYDALREALVTSQEWTGGVAFSDYNAILLGVPLDQVEFADEALPHELNHLLVNRLTFNCVGARLPTWLAEGLAMSAEGPLSDSSRQKVLAELEAGRLPTLQSLAGGFSAYSDQANLSYLQSQMAVTYLIETYGPQKMRTLLETIASGKTIDEALNEIYSLDTDGLDVAWRGALGFTFIPPARAQAEATATPVPTLALWTAPVRTAEALTDRAILVEDVTIPEGMNVQPGENFIKTWRLQNAGTSTWNASYQLVFISGDPMGGPDRVALTGQVPPGGQLDISVYLTAPSQPGRYRGVWQMVNSANEPFEDALWVEINVVGGTLTPGAGTAIATLTPTRAVSPTSTPTPTPKPRGAPWLWGGLAAFLILAGLTLALAIIDLRIFRRTRSGPK